jgi:hypothetical protein
MASAALVLGLSMVPVAAAEEEEYDPNELFTCTAADGTVSLQQEPCEAAKPAPKKNVPAPKPSAKKAPAPVLPKAKSVTYVLRESGAPSTSVAPPLKNVPWEPTWKAFVEAMHGGDGAGALRCLTSRALKELGPRIESSTPEALKGMIEPYDRVVVEGDVGPYWSIRVLRAGARPKWVFFERTARGEWKIAAI